MNHILTLQNAEPQLRLLRARRYTYLIGKRLLSLQVFLTVGVPVIGALGVLFWPNLKAYVAIASLVIAILDVTLFDRVQRTLRKRAATMQEQFDCIVLELPWEKFTVGAKLEPETIHAAASKHLGGADDPKLRDWYPAVVGDVPLYLARIICQRTNLWYDAKLRRQYGASVLGGTIALTVLLFIFGLIGGLTLESFVLTVLAPAAPIIIWGVREFFRQRDATDVLDRVKSEAEALWDRAKTGGCTEPDCTAQSRQFQNAIFERRSTSPLIFDWIYKIQRSGLEEQMNIGAQELVREIDAQLLKTGTV
jgi:SMODS-associating 4TM effector domain